MYSLLYSSSDTKGPEKGGRPTQARSANAMVLAFRLCCTHRPWNHVCPICQMGASSVDVPRMFAVHVFPSAVRLSTFAPRST